ncbi:MAG TPA: hypothetical protein VGD78_22920 [Chthoniobacterales bacterium]
MTKIRLALIAACVALLFPQTGSAQGTLYTVNGVFPANEPTTAYSAPNAAFTLTFLIPAAVPDSEPPHQPFHGYTPLHAGSYTFNGTTTAFTGGTYHEDSTTAGNEFVVDLTTTSGLDFGLYGVANTFLTGTGIQGNALSLQVPGEPAVGFNSPAAKGATVNGFTMNIMGYYPATNVPLTQISAPNTAFLVEYTIPNPSPNPHFAYFLYGSVTFQGVTHPCDVSLSYYYHSPTFEAIVCATDVGLVEFYTIYAGHAPVLFRASGPTFTVPLGPLGAGRGWSLYSNVGPTSFHSAMVLPAFIARRF